TRVGSHAASARRSSRAIRRTPSPSIALTRCRSRPVASCSAPAHQHRPSLTCVVPPTGRVPALS
ncbi:hypothetical protein U1Q18_046588, partial [Sarracenia purpurea var. burkii]